MFNARVSATAADTPSSLRLARKRSRLTVGNLNRRVNSRIGQVGFGNDFTAPALICGEFDQIGKFGVRLDADQHH
jgi:hypothetical protein